MLPSPSPLAALGWNARWEAQFAPWAGAGRCPGRVAVQDKHHYQVLAASGEVTAQVRGRVLHEARDEADLPKVGDWIVYEALPEPGRGSIVGVLPRASRLSRKTVGRRAEEQVLVANVHVAFLVQGLDRAFNPGLVKRQLAMVRESGIQPVVVLNKIDVCPVMTARVREAEQVASDVPVIPTCARTGRGLDALACFVRPGETVVFIGPSGVGKSSLINDLYGASVQATAEVRTDDAKGRHTTTWRELILLPQGGCVIDTPGMREFHIWLAGEGVHEAYPEIEALALRCRFSNCSHTREPGCEVQAAVQRGELAPARLRGFHKLRQELQYLEAARHWHTGAPPRRAEGRSARRGGRPFRHE